MGYAGDDFFDLRHKAHLRHVVSLVEHHHARVRQVGMTLSHQIGKPARGSDDQVHSALE